MVQVYSCFGSKKFEDSVICKSQITRKNMRKIGIPDFIPIEDIRKDFDKVKRDWYIRRGNFLTGQTRITRYVKKFDLYQAVIKGRY